MGSVLVEFAKEDTAQTVAHALHMRKFDRRTVMASYYPLAKVSAAARVYIST